ncbi:MAG: hypothetical protein ABFD16_01985 [Thermoguttaceae bacterium]
MARRVYQTVAVKKVSVEQVLASLAEGPVEAGVDIGKEVLVTVLRDRAGKFAKGWKTRQPGELRALVGVLAEVARRRWNRRGPTGTPCGRPWPTRG